MKKFIQNRQGQNVCVVVEGPEAPGKLAFVMHGLSGNKNEPHIRKIIEAFLNLDYTVVSFDTTNTDGESDGQLEDATLTGYYNDLEDVIAWAATQPWYSEPFVLAGHSFGGIATTLFAEHFPKKVRALAPISTVVSGELTLQTPKRDPRVHYLDEWKRAGVREYEDHGVTKRLKWACMEDRLKYSVLDDVAKLTMPVLLAVGGEDENTPPEHQRILFNALPGPKELHIIDGAVHTFDEEAERLQLQRLVEQWAKAL